MTEIIVVTSGKGGVGKTTTSASFSTGLAHGRKVDQHGVKVEKTGRIGHALGQVHGKLRRVRGLEHHRHHGQ